MTKLSRIGVTAAVIAVIGLSSVSRPEQTQDAQDETSREIMWSKLDLAHDVLDALALEDFEALEAYAEDLEALGTAGFLFILDTDEYKRRADGFRLAARDLRRAAEERNTEAAALAYMDLTLRCIRCHHSLGVLPR